MRNNHRLEPLFFMTRALQQAMSDGIESWADDTGERKAWLENDPLAWHVFAGSMLVGLFAFTEGRIGRSWWAKLNSESAKRDLPILWRARNAFVHADNKLIQNEFNTAKQISDFKDYCVSLQKGELRDDKGNVYPAFMNFDGSMIHFNKVAINHFRVLFEVAFHAERLGRLNTQAK